MTLEQDGEGCPVASAHPRHQLLVADLLECVVGRPHQPYSRTSVLGGYPFRLSPPGPCVRRRITFAVVVDNRPYQWSDPAFLQSEQYRSEANLRARQSIYEHQQPRVNLPQAVMDIVAPNLGEVVVDIGGGNGAYLAELGRRGHRGPIVGIDFSQGMLRAAQEAMPAAHTVLADARAVPLSDCAATLALAMHMLYHVPEPAVAVNEMRRALAPGGRLVVALNADDHLSELRLAVEQARHDAGLPERAFGEHLLLSQGADLLGQVFGFCRTP